MLIFGHAGHCRRSLFRLGSKDLPLPEAYIHSEWINLHRGPFFAEWVQFLVDELNRVGKGREDLTELQQRWNQAVALELAFF